MLLEAKIQANIIDDKKAAKDTYEKMIERYPNFIEGYHSYWRFLHKNGQEENVS